MPIYKVTDKASGHVELVNALNKSRASAHLAAKRFEIAAIASEETAELMASGVTYSVATGEPNASAVSASGAEGCD